jgi:ribosome recycling factor
MNKFIDSIKDHMLKTFNSLKKEFSSLRTSRVSASILDKVTVDIFNNISPLSYVSTVTVFDSRSLIINVWDNQNVKPIEKAIRDSNLGLSMSIDGLVIRVFFPELTKERRIELVKIASKYSEQCKISIRNLRRNGMDDVKKQEKEGIVSKDEKYRLSALIQNLTDDNIRDIDKAFKTKEKEIMQI